MKVRLIPLLCVVLMLGFIGSSAFGLTLDIRLTDGNDDAEEHLADGSMDITSTDLEFPYEDDGNPSATDPQLNVLRFVLPIPKGAQISKAYLEFLSLKSKEIPDRTDPSKMRSVPNYEDSAFETVEPIGNDEKIEKIHNSLFKLAEFIDPKKYKSKEELNAELSKFLIKAGIDNKLLPEINSSVPVKVQNSNESTVPVNVQLPVNEPIAPEDVADIPLNVVEDEDEFIKSIRMKND